MPRAIVRCAASRAAISRAVAGASLLLLAAVPALAQGGPFGVGLPEQALLPAGTGTFADAVAWIMREQADFYRRLTAAVRDLANRRGAAGPLLLLSFLYGAFHAAGPGHGKAVLTSYVLASQATWRRGVVLCFAAALVQAASAVLLVSTAALLLGASGVELTNAARGLEIASYAFLTVVGAWLFCRTGLLSPALPSTGPVPAGAGHHHPHSHGGDTPCRSCGPTAVAGEAAGASGWREATAAVLAVGLRPCTGAVIVLVFALSQDLYVAGIAATFAMGLGTAITVAGIATFAVFARSAALRLASGSRRRAAALGRAVELTGAALVFAFGLLLLTGALLT